MQVELALARDEFFAMAGHEPETGTWAITTLTPQTAGGLSNLLDRCRVRASRSCWMR
jgi:hypothetical protein